MCHQSKTNLPSALTTTALQGEKLNLIEMVNNEIFPANFFACSVAICQNKLPAEVAETNIVTTFGKIPVIIWLNMICH